MMKKKIWVFLSVTLLILITFVFSQFKLFSNRQTIKQINSAKVPPLKAQGLLDQGERYLSSTISDSLAKGYDYANKAKALGQKSNSFRDEGLAYLLKAKLLLKQKQLALARNQADSAARIFHRAHLHVDEGEAYLELSIINQVKVIDFPVALNYADRSIEILSKTAPLSPSLGRAYQFSGWLHYYNGQLKAALRDLENSLTIANQNHNGKVQKIHETMAISYLQTGEIGKFWTNLNQALGAAQYYKDTTVLFETYTIYASFYRRKNEIGSEINYLEKARQISDYGKDDNHAIWIASYLGKAYNSIHQYNKSIPLLVEGIRKGKPDEGVSIKLYDNLMEAYVATGQFEKAKAIYGTVSEQIKNLPFRAASEAHFSSIKLFLATHELKKAREHLVVFQQLRKTYHDISEVIPVEELSFKVDSAQGYLAEAIRDQQRYNTLTDSVSRMYHRKQVAELEVQYQTQKKDLEIANKTKNIKLLTRAFAGEKQARNFAFVAIGLLLIILALGVSRYRLKLRANKDMAEKHLEIENKNRSLEKLLEERELLLKEIHHRVKNNLQVIISLLNSQSSYLQDPRMLAVLNESQNRINAISMIHQKLYQNENLTTIDMPSYIEEMVHSLEQGLYTNDIQFYFDIDDIALDVQQAVPVGLILNEAITNAIKYAFKDVDDKEINISLKELPASQLLLEINDNGRGFPANFEVGRGTSLGMSLMHGLAKQINAKLNIKSIEGVAITLHWSSSFYVDSGAESKSHQTHLS